MQGTPSSTTDPNGKEMPMVNAVIRMRRPKRGEPRAMTDSLGHGQNFETNVLQIQVQCINAPNHSPNAPGSLGNRVEPRLIHILDEPMLTRQLARSNANRVCWAMTPAHAVRQIGSRQRFGVSPMTQTSDWGDAMGCRGAQACGRSSGVTMVMGPAGAD